MGGTTQEGIANLLTPEQQQFLSGILGGGTGQAAGSAYQSFLQPSGGQQTQDIFNQSVVNPAMLNYQQQILPAIQQRFVDSNAGSSSALNQALAQSATDLTTQLGSQYGNFYQNQQSNQLNALGQLGGQAGQRTFQPLINQSSGILGNLIGAGGQIGAAGLMAASSIEVKENVRPYNKGLDVIKNLDVKIYDYIESVGGQKDKVGVIAEKVPAEIQGEIDGIKAVDLYGLIGLLINSVKELSAKICKLEAKCQQ